MYLLDSLIGLLAPHHCLGCGRAGMLLCGDCQMQYINSLPSRCYRCHAQTVDWSVCGKCRGASPLKRVMIAVEYDPLIKQLIHSYKFERAIAASRPIAELLTRFDVSLYDAVIPIPTAPRRIRVRGYDHILLVTKYIGRQGQLRLLPALQRISNSRQVGATRAVRIKQAQHSYQCVPRYKAELQGKHVLLIDDLVTTGATLEATAHLLKQVGARSVSALVLTQKH